MREGLRNVLLGPAQLYDCVSDLVEQAAGTGEGAELVGLLPRAVLDAIAPTRWARLGLSAGTTVEARLIT